MSLDYPEDQLASEVAGEVVRYRQSMWQAGKWLALLRSPSGWRRLMTVAANFLAWNGGKLLRIFGRVLRMPLDKDLHASLLRIAERRRTILHFIFAKKDPGQLFMSEQAPGAMRRMLRSGAMTLDVIDDANHTFSTFKSRQQLMDALARLLAQP